MKELVMRKLQRVAMVAALAAGLGVVDTAASATTAAPAHRTQAATASPAHAAGLTGNERLLEVFLHDVINEHNGGQAINHLNAVNHMYGGPVATGTVYSNA